ncbi:MAG: MarR family transcriptional regulator [Terricaulis sp.]|nr:MarR family transcriptional regulator [Terricaulis sp.]
MKQVQYRTFVRLEGALQHLGVSAVQYRVLAAIQRKRYVSSAELARIFDVRPQTMFKQIAALEARALIKRHVSEANKRVLEMELTAEGEALLKSCAQVAAAVEKELFSEFTDGELAMYSEFMLRMIASARSTPRARGGD